MLRIVSHALEFGVVLSAVLFVTLLLILRANPEIMLKDYPPDIQAKWGPLTDLRSVRIFVAMLLLILSGAVVAESIKSFPGAAAVHLTFATMFVHFLVMFGTFNLLDWLVLDWLIIVRGQPSFIVLPGTEGMPSYRNYRFHFQGFLIGIPIVVAGSAVLAAIVGIIALKITLPH